MTQRSAVTVAGERKCATVGAPITGKVGVEGQGDLLSGRDCSANSRDALRGAAYIHG